MAELIEKVSLPGERVDYYAISPETWQRSLEMRLATFLPLRDAAREGLDGMKQDDACRKRLLEMIDWVDMVEGLMQDLAGRWQSRKKTPEMPG